MKILAKKGKLVIFVFVLILVIFLLNVFQKEVREFFYWFSAPIQKVLWRVGDRETENDQLKQKNQELLAEIAQLKEIKKEDEVLREALGIELQKDFKLSLAQIIGKDISQDFILIDKGSDDGVLENMPVITEQKVLVGKIKEVYKNFSKVMLISNKKSFFDAKIQNEEKDISGIIKGQGNFEISFDFVPREENLLQGDIVITSALGGIFPKGLLVGEIAEIGKSDIEPFQKLKIIPLFDIKEIEMLFIIL